MRNNVHSATVSSPALPVSQHMLAYSWRPFEGSRTCLQASKGSKGKDKAMIVAGKNELQNPTRCCCSQVGAAAIGATRCSCSHSRCSRCSCSNSFIRARLHIQHCRTTQVRRCMLSYTCKRPADLARLLDQHVQIALHILTLHIFSCPCISWWLYGIHQRALQSSTRIHCAVQAEHTSYTE